MNRFQSPLLCPAALNGTVNLTAPALVIRWTFVLADWLVWALHRDPKETRLHLWRPLGQQLWLQSMLQLLYRFDQITCTSSWPLHVALDKPQKLLGDPSFTCPDGPSHALAVLTWARKGSTFHTDSANHSVPGRNEIAWEQVDWCKLYLSHQFSSYT